MMRTHLVGVAVLTVAIGMAVPASACNKLNLTGCVAPELTMLGGLNGASAQTKIKGWRGRPILLKFWAPSCSPCRKSLSEVERLHKRYGAKGLEVLSISVGSQAASKALVAKGKLTMPVGFDTLQKTMASYKVKAIPATFLLDRRGVVRPIGDNLEAAVKRELRRGRRRR